MRKIILFLAVNLMITLGYANPVVDHVAAGNVSIQQTNSSTVVNQTSQKAIINWKSFNIGSQESTHFQQPAGGVAFNRISPTQGPSAIYGRLTATGQIILVNPAGFFFGASSFVNVGGLVATTSNLSNQDFLNGNYRFTRADGYADAAIVNEGQIIAMDHGLIALVAPQVVNKGLIQANLGNVILASGSAATITFAGNDLIHFKIDEKATGNKRGVQNTQTGRIIADGGSVLITANAAKNVLDNVINMQGVVQARSVSEKNGEIILAADEDAGVVTVSGLLDASGMYAGQLGGNVQITGYNLLIDQPAVINVSGDSGGGNIHIGGNYRGEGSLPHANATILAAGASLRADAITNGDGGEIVLWADNTTRAYGNISARGGANSGNGGLVETSSYYYLDTQGLRVDTSAPRGKVGSWLLDPYDVYITNSATSNGTFSGGDPNIFTPTGDNSNILVSDLLANLTTADVTIETTGAGSQNGDIYVNVPFDLVSPHILSLFPDGQIFLNSVITVSSTATLYIGGPASGTAGIVLNGGTLSGNVTGSLTSPITLATGTSSTILPDPGIFFPIIGNINGAGSLTIGNIELIGNIGNSTQLTSLTTSSDITLNGSINSSGDQTYNNRLFLSGNSSISSANGSLTFDSIDGNFNLTTNSADTTTFNVAFGDTTPINNLTVNASNIVLNNNGGITNGSQFYNGPVTLANNVLLISNGTSNSTISLARGVTGNQSLSLRGVADSVNYNFIVGGSLALDNIVITGAGNSTFTLNANSPQAWTLTGSNSGNVTGVSGVSGTISFSDIQNIAVNNSQTNEIVLENKANSVNVTGGGSGYINDPINFSGFQVFRSVSGRDIAYFDSSAIVNRNNSTAIVNGSLMSFVDFSDLVGGTSSSVISSVIEQGNPPVSDNKWIDASSVNDNLDTLVSDLGKEYNETLAQLKIIPNCYTAN